MPHCRGNYHIPFTSYQHLEMKNSFAISLIFITVAQCAVMDALQQSDVTRFKTLSHRVNEFTDINDKYYCIQLASELKEKLEPIVQIGKGASNRVELYSEERNRYDYGKRDVLL